MRLPGTNRGGYNLVSADVSEQNHIPSVSREEDDALIPSHDREDMVFANELDNAATGVLESQDGSELPLEPPSYINVDSEYATPQDMEEMNIEEPFNYDNTPITNKIGRIFNNFSDHVVTPVKKNIVDPLVLVLNFLSEKIDFYLNKIGNPLILRRFFYIIIMSIIAWIIMASGSLPNKRATHSRGVFADHDILLDYARKSVDLSKLERDLEYISSMPHMSGTKGDSAVKHYIEESFNNNGLKLVKELEYKVFASYPGNASLSAIETQNGNKILDIDLTKDNFNPMSNNGKLQNINLIYGYKGREADLKQLKEKEFLDEEFVLLLNYDELVSEQILLAQKYNAKAVIFVSEKYKDDGDIVQMKSVGLPQYGSGDPLTPGWFGSTIDPIKLSESKYLPQIPTIPLSYNKAQLLLNLLKNEGIKFENGLFSGNKNDVKVNLEVETAMREHHPVTDVIGKIEGREQTDKAIIIAASRGSIHNGAKYPSFGSAVLLSLVQSFQEMKYKYDWKPLRNIYFISFGGTEFNYVGATELIEERLSMLKDEIYSFVDVSELGIWDEDRKINIESHPVLHQFFNDDDNKMGFDVNVQNIHHYGDWLPFLANGIPVSVLSSVSVRDKDLPIDTKLDTFENISESLKNIEKGVLATDLIVYLFKIGLKLVDTPLMPFHVDDYVVSMDRAFREFENKIEGKLNFQSITKGLLLWKRIGMEWSSWKRAWEQLVLEHEEGIEPSLVAVHRWTWNKKLSNIGRRQCVAAGLPNRPFYKNVLFSPPIWTDGNTVPNSWLFPGVQDAIHDGSWQAAQTQLDDIGKIIEYSANVFIEETNDVGF